MVKLKLSNYLKADQLKALGISAVFVNEGQIIDKADTGFKYDTFEISVRFPKGEVELWGMNWTSQKLFIEAYGDDTAKWIGKTVNFATQLMMVNNKQIDVIYGRPNIETVK